MFFLFGFGKDFAVIIMVIKALLTFKKGARKVKEKELELKIEELEERIAPVGGAEPGIQPTRLLGGV